MSDQDVIVTRNDIVDTAQERNDGNDDAADEEELAIIHWDLPSFFVEIIYKLYMLLCYRACGARSGCGAVAAHASSRYCTTLCYLKSLLIASVRSKNEKMMRRKRSFLKVPLQVLSGRGR
ncbi:hypothetical protein KSD_64180 [Ktedonobacter sp. SOSP1-85]|nr:hypothetical protein KSD_64180 [Ktedonobacter sp. SOSP1-85]